MRTLKTTLAAIALGAGFAANGCAGCHEKQAERCIVETEGWTNVLAVSSREDDPLCNSMFGFKSNYSYEVEGDDPFWNGYGLRMRAKACCGNPDLFEGCNFKTAWKSGISWERAQ